MPEHLKALVIILALSWPAFHFGRRLVGAGLVTMEAFVLRRNVWIAITLVSFLAHNFWLYVLGTAVILIAVRGREKNPLALFFFVLFAVPPIQALIPGLGILGHVFAIDHLRLLTLVLLLPAVLGRSSAGPRLPFGRAATDVFIALYILLMLAFQFVLNSWTGAVRASFYLILDILIPYYAASRLMADSTSFKDTVASLLMAVILLVPIALFEYSRHWLLYSALADALGEVWGFGRYLGRDDSLRALATAGHPITLGYIVVVGLSLYFFVGPFITERKYRIAGWLLLPLALFVTVARGPWVGGVVAALVATALRPDAAKQFGRLVAIGVVAVPALLISPWRDSVIRYVPFVGTVDTGSIDYREQLFNVSIQVLAQSPFFGAYDYMQNPAMEQLRQGEGLIDMVNTYLAVAMGSGLVGLTFFAGVFVSAAWLGWRRLRQLDADAPQRGLGVALVSALMGVMVMIATTSPVGAIPLLYWTLSGLAVAYANLSVWEVSGDVDTVAVDRAALWRPARYSSPGIARMK